MLKLDKFSTWDPLLCLPLGQGWQRPPDERISSAELLLSTWLKRASIKFHDTVTCEHGVIRNYADSMKIRYIIRGIL